MRWRAPDAHAAYLGEMQGGALLGEADAELQRELSLLLRTLQHLHPPLRRLHLLARPPRPRRLWLPPPAPWPLICVDPMRTSAVGMRLQLPPNRGTGAC